MQINISCPFLSVIFSFLDIINMSLRPQHFDIFIIAYHYCSACCYSRVKWDTISVCKQYAITFKEKNKIKFSLVGLNQQFL